MAFFSICETLGFEIETYDPPSNPPPPPTPSLGAP